MTDIISSACYIFSVISFIAGNYENGRYLCILGLLLSTYSKLKDE